MKKFPCFVLALALTIGSFHAYAAQGSSMEERMEYHYEQLVLLHRDREAADEMRGIIQALNDQIDTNNKNNGPNHKRTEQAILLEAYVQTYVGQAVAQVGSEYFASKAAYDIQDPGQKSASVRAEERTMQDFMHKQQQKVMKIQTTVGDFAESKEWGSKTAQEKIDELNLMVQEIDKILNDTTIGVVT